ncbi:Zinc resistance conferring protein [Coemansia sp. RSA 1972]|nr:Zinc resistance conferring protein [Coemansia sp. RSA 1972]
MALSRSAKVGIMLFLSLTMFFVELIVGIVAGSIALVADSFHMLNDVLGMAIALWAIVMAKSTKTVPNNTYGWQRAEILGALTNGVLLLGLCLTIYIDAIERFIQIEEVRRPQLVMVVGCVGLVFNLLGLGLFHEHSHHAHSHSHAHDDEAVADEQEGLIASGSGNNGNGYAAIDMDNQSIIGVPHPVYTHQAIIRSAQQMLDERGAPPAQPQKKLRHAKKNNGGHLNMRGVWLHVFGDCVTNVAVIISGLVIWKAEGSWRFYVDPAISLLINTLVVAITLPLVKSASFILLNGVPSSVDLDELRRELKAIPHVLNVHDLHVWQLSDTKNVASVHVLIDRPPFHECIHNSTSSSSLQSQEQTETRLVTRNRQPLGSPSVDMDCLYMDVATAVKRIMHAHGVHSTTIQPEFVVGQAVSLATTADASVSNVAIAGDLAHQDSQATIGPCLLMCRSQGECQPSACCPDESPIKVVSQTP